MVISENKEAELSMFASLVQKTTTHLNNDASRYPEKYKKLEGIKLEPCVEEVMNFFAKGTPFEGTIKRWGGSKFPDIVAKQYYGVEVKTTTGNHWTTLGNSILESTRVENVEHIFMLFGKLSSPIEFKSRPYHECLADIVVTHYPRYIINMDLPAGETIFDKIGMPYEHLRRLETPTIPVANHYRSQLTEGQSLWWLGDSADEIEAPSPMTITMWNLESRNNHDHLTAEGMVYFPELILSKDIVKYNRFSLWLIIQKGILYPNVRDRFSAGGKTDLRTSSKTYSKLPRIYTTVSRHKKLILHYLKSSELKTLEQYWQRPLDHTESRLKVWIEMVASHGMNDQFQGNLDIFRSIFAEWL